MSPSHRALYENVVCFSSIHTKLVDRWSHSDYPSIQSAISTARVSWLQVDNNEKLSWTPAPYHRRCRDMSGIQLVITSFVNEYWIC